MQREVCLKHRNNRREIILRVRTQIRVGSGVCSFLSYAARASQPAPLICGHRSRAGLLSANQVMPVQFRLTAPIFRIQPHGGRQLAQQSLQNSAGSGQHRDAVPFFIRAQQRECADSIARGKAGRARDDAWLRPPCEPSRILQGSQMGRHRPHKPKTSGFDSRPCDQFSKRAARSFRRSPALQAGEHGAKPWRSTFFKSREG